MKLRNKKTGEIKDILDVIHQAYSERNEKSLMNLEKEWEDYEEPKKSTRITGPVAKDDNTVLIEFYTHEGAEKAVEKFKAWKRLKDKGFKFNGWTIDDGLRISICTNIDEDDIYDDDKRKIKSDLDLLFGGE